MGIHEVVSRFCFQGVFLQAHPFGHGHINDTYSAWFRKECGTLHRYLLQRINHHVFSNPEQLMENISRVIEHLRAKIAASGGDPQRQTLTLIPTIDGGSFVRTSQGEYWRAYVFIEGAQTYETVESRAHVYNASRAFGSFQRLLADFSAEQLHETIAGFHDTSQRFAAFVRSTERDIMDRAQAVRDEIAFVERRNTDTAVLVDLLREGKIPWRVTHNDTKFNNVMIDNDTGEGICVIDLDTVMPGSALYDFGDSVRSAANTAAEDERDLAKVRLDMDVFRHLTRGYLDATRDCLTPLEIEYLPFAAKLMALECGMRFLTDYLNGDTYFKVHRDHHNLDRCRTQFKLVRDMELGSGRMAKIVRQYK